MKTNYNAKKLTVAEKRIETLVRDYHLNPIVQELFEQGKVCYSYVTGNGLIGSVDTVSYNPEYEEAIKDFEEKYKGLLVYHAIETVTEFGTLLALMYVKKTERSGRVTPYTNSYMVNIENPEYSEFGSIHIRC